jgi:hypothetical protein
MEPSGKGGEASEIAGVAGGSRPGVGGLPGWIRLELAEFAVADVALVTHGRPLWCRPGRDGQGADAVRAAPKDITRVPGTPR